MKTFSQFLLMVLVVAATGCTDVLVDKPFGETPARLVAEEWNGTWVIADEAIVFKVADTNGGHLRIAGIETHQQGVEFRLAVRDVYARMVNRGLFLTLAMPGGDGTTNFVWGKALMKPDELQVWIPVHKEFERLVKQGTLPGTASSNSVALRNLTREHLNRIEKETDGKLFDPEHPLTLRRLKDK